MKTKSGRDTEQKGGPKVASKPAATPTLTKPSDREIRIERVFNAPREKVWRAWTEPELVAQWWGRGNKLDIEKFELKPEGQWRFVEHAPDSDQGFEGVFREVTQPKRIVQTFGWDGMPGHVVIDTLELIDLGDGRTKAVTVSQFHSAQERDAMLDYGMEGGLAESYAALDKVLASMS